MATFHTSHSTFRASLVAQRVKNLSALWKNQIPSLGWEEPLEKELATHSSILAWRIPWTEEPGGGAPGLGGFWDFPRRRGRVQSCFRVKWGEANLTPSQLAACSWG